MKAIVIYATITGNNEDVADIIVEALEDLDVSVTESEISQTDAQTLLSTDIVVVVPYTYDEGSLPEEGLDFYDDLLDMKLPQTVFGVAGSGDVFYGDDYGVAVDKFEEAFIKTGAIKGSQSVKVNLSPDESDIEKLDTFAKQLTQAVEKKL
ncbi:flavodoxin [Furfurilactobacillus cerevisiae]|uniref:flavodoxin n=1 Tax=Furfurilactobacillus rossiae TaxID=231049 RepID=UPI003B9873B3